MKGIGALVFMIVMFLGVIVFVALETSENLALPKKYKYKKVTYSGGKVIYYTYYKVLLFWRHYGNVFYESFTTEKEAREALEKRREEDLYRKANRRIKSEDDFYV